MQMQPFRLLRFRNRIELELLLSLLVDRLRTVLSRQGFAAPRRNGAPLTAPGRSEEPFLNMRERRIGKLMTLASKHLAVSRPRRRTPKPRGPAQWQGAGCRNFSRLPARGGVFSLDILFYRTRSAERISKSRG